MYILHLNILQTPYYTDCHLNYVPAKYKSTALLHKNFYFLKLFSVKQKPPEHTIYVGWDSIAGIATCHGLDSLGIKSQRG
jgi:hypothetical protein